MYTVVVESAVVLYLVWYKLPFLPLPPTPPHVTWQITGYNGGQVRWQGVAGSPFSEAGVTRGTRG